MAVLCCFVAALGLSYIVARRLPAIFFGVPLAFLALQLHWQALTLDPRAWKSHAAVQALANGSSPDPLFYPEGTSSLTGYEKLLACLLPAGWDPLILEWILDPFLLLASITLLWHLLRRYGATSASATCVVGLAFLLGWNEAAPSLLQSWHGAVPVAVSLLISALVLLDTVLPRRLLGALITLGLAGLAIAPGTTTDLLLPLASLACALPLGLGLHWLWDSTRFRGLSRAAAVIVAFLLLTPFAQALAPSLVRVYSERGWPLMVPPALWRVQRPELGTTLPDISCAQLLATQQLPGELLLTNLGGGPTGLAPDAVVAALSGVHIAGWEATGVSLSPQAFRRDSLSLALVASGRPDLLWNSGVSWLLLQPPAEGLEQALARSPHVRLEFSSEHGATRRTLWRVAPSPSLAVGRLPSQPPFRSRTVLMTPDGPRSLERLENISWSLTQPYRLQVSAFNEQSVTARLGWLRLEVLNAEGKPAMAPLFYLLGANPLPSGTGDQQEVTFITPDGFGEYLVRGSLLTRHHQSETLFEFPLELSVSRQGPSLIGGTSSRSWMENL